MPGLVIAIPHEEEPRLVPVRPSQAQQASTRIRNRRKRYLELNASYFSSNLESADPLLYDRLVRRWLTEDEARAERQRGGLSGTLESGVRRSEARLQAVESGEPTRLRQGQGGQLIADVEDDLEGLLKERPETREGDWAQWKSAMEARFVAGEDRDFDYANVDNDETYDHTTEALHDLDDAYFDAEEPEFEVQNGQLSGETGIQDY